MSFPNVISLLHYNLIEETALPQAAAVFSLRSPDQVLLLGHMLIHMTNYYRLERMNSIVKYLSSTCLVTGPVL